MFQLSVSTGAFSKKSLTPPTKKHIAKINEKRRMIQKNGITKSLRNP